MRRMFSIWAEGSFLKGTSLKALLTAIVAVLGLFAWTISPVLAFLALFGAVGLLPIERRVRTSLAINRMHFNSYRRSPGNDGFSSLPDSRAQADGLASSSGRLRGSLIQSYLIEWSTGSPDSSPDYGCFILPPHSIKG